MMADIVCHSYAVHLLEANILWGYRGGDGFGDIGFGDDLPRLQHAPGIQYGIWALGAIGVLRRYVVVPRRRRRHGEGLLRALVKEIRIVEFQLLDRAIHWFAKVEKDKRASTSRFCGSVDHLRVVIRGAGQYHHKT